MLVSSEDSVDARKRTTTNTAQPFDVKAFTREAHERQVTRGWQFEAGWFRRVSGLEWAWFSRRIAEWKW